jgi:hypothetical protein
MGAVRTAIGGLIRALNYGCSSCGEPGTTFCDAGAARYQLGAAMNDLLVIGITIVIFAALFLLVRVVERLER